MKMEFLIRATHDHKVKEIRVKEAQFVQMGERLITFEPDTEALKWYPTQQFDIKAVLRKY